MVISTTVLVVGAGPAGLLTAAELQRRGVECLLIDAHERPLDWDRATVVHPRSLEILDTLGILDPLLAAGVKQRRARIHAGMTQEHLADRVGVSQQYLSLCLAGKRKWPVTVVVAVSHTTGSLAPIQWVCKQVGGELYCDPVEQRKAKLRAELADLEGK